MWTCKVMTIYKSVLCTDDISILRCPCMLVAKPGILSLSVSSENIGCQSLKHLSGFDVTYVDYQHDISISICHDIIASVIVW